MSVQSLGWRRRDQVLLRAAITDLRCADYINVHVNNILSSYFRTYYSSSTLIRVLLMKINKKFQIIISWEKVYIELDYS